MKTFLRLGGLFLTLTIMIIGMYGVAGCGSGSGNAVASNTGDNGGGAGATGGTGSALTVAEQVSVVDAKAAPGGSNLIKASVSALPANSDYNMDEAHTFVEERSADGFDIVNEILCMMDQTLYDHPSLINQGDYLAQLDLNLCNSNDDSVSNSSSQSSQNQSSGSTMPDYESWTVNSYREDDTSAHQVAVWVHQEEDEWEPAMVIEALASITSSKTEKPPYGLFQMNFKAVLEDGETEAMSGYLQAVEDDGGDILLQFYASQTGGPEMGGHEGGEATLAKSAEDEGMSERVTMVRDPSGLAGAGTISFSENGFGNKTFNIAFNENYFLRSDESGNAICLDRNNYNSTVHRYNLYSDENSSTPGEQVVRSSGFPIRYVADNGNDYHGYVGYWGLWLEDDLNLSSGVTVYKDTFGPEGEDSSDPYTLLIVNGKLKKHVRKTMTMDEIAGVPLEYGRCDMNSGCTHYAVEWNKDDEKLYATAQFGEEDWIPQQFENPIAVELDEDAFSFDFWSQSLGGNGHVNLDNPETGDKIPLSNDSQVVFFTEEVVMPGDPVPTTLACFEDCLNPETIDTDNPYFEQSTWEAGMNTFRELAFNVNAQTVANGPGTYYIPYTFDSEAMMLKYGDSDVVTTSSESNEFGTNTRALIDVHDIDQLVCDWDVNNTCTFKINDELDEFYSWETGPNDWNRLALLMDPTTEEFLEFEPPLMVEYTHGSGSKYVLQYSGPGDLWGIPGKCVNMDTGEDVDCESNKDDFAVRWINEFSVPDGAIVVDVSDNSTTYYVKGMEKEQQMIPVDTANCTAAGLTLTTYDLPDSSNYVEPVIGAEPDIEGAPAVIGGVYQGN